MYCDLPEDMLWFDCAESLEYFGEVVLSGIVSLMLAPACFSSFCFDYVPALECDFCKASSLVDVHFILLGEGPSPVVAYLLGVLVNVLFL